MKTFKFNGIPSGNYETFGYAVSRDDFIKIEGHEPREFDRDKFFPELFTIFPEYYLPKGPYNSTTGHCDPAEFIMTFDDDGVSIRLA